MLKPYISCSNISWKAKIDRQITTNAVYIVTFSYLILFSIFNSLYLEKPPALEPYQPEHYNIENVVVNTVGCSFPISGYYERTPRYICYFLLVFSIVIRNHKWLAAGAAASVLTYSGVAAIHSIMLFATNNRLDLPKAKSLCESISVPNASTPFVACAGVTDPDVNLSMTKVSSVMLGALPRVACSTTFRRSTSKAILMFWLLLLAVGHTFYALTISNPSVHYQICPKNYIEPLPGNNFQAPSLDQSWRDSFSSFVSTMQKSPRNDSSPACIYTCFATKGYLGRKTQDITVWDGIGVQHPVFKSTAAHRLGGVMFWWSYTLLALLTLFTTEKKGRLPKRLHKLLFLIEYRQQSLASWWNWKNVTSIAIKRTEDPIITTDSSEATISVKIHVTVLKLVQLFTQFISVGAFCGSIISQETQNVQMWSALSQEPFQAVGQWSNLAVVLLVLVAAGVSRIWVGSGLGRAVVLERRSLEEGIEKSQKGKALNRGTSSIDDAGAKTDYWKDGEDEDVETEKEDWDWRIGYAS